MFPPVEMVRPLFDVWRVASATRPEHASCHGGAVPAPTRVALGCGGSAQRHGPSTRASAVDTPAGQTAVTYTDDTLTESPVMRARKPESGPALVEHAELIHEDGRWSVR